MPTSGDPATLVIHIYPATDDGQPRLRFTPAGGTSVVDVTGPASVLAQLAARGIEDHLTNSDERGTPTGPIATVSPLRGRRTA